MKDQGKLTRIKAPTFPCGTCGTMDWNWNETMDRWECRTCVIYGRNEPEKPVQHYTPVDEWTHQILEDYDKAFQQLEVEKNQADNQGQAVTIMKIARVKRAEKQLAIASIRADAASLVQQLQRSTTKGEVYLDIPEADLKVRLQW